MAPADLLMLAAEGLALVFLGAWLWQLRTGNAGMVDPLWALSLGALAPLYAALAGGAPLSRLLVAIGGGLWGLRLGLHLWRRNAGKPEDARYRKLREDWGDSVQPKLLGLFLLQGIISLALSVAFLFPCLRDHSPGAATVLAFIVLWLIAVIGESVADSQLRRFASQPENRGEVCRVGLWQWSRHPNYFFECLHWVAYVPLALGTPWGWLTALAPVLMGALLWYVSGIPLLEAHLLATRSGYADYMRTTSALVPWPPRHPTQERKA
ncbi:hypothetical protein BKK79_01845 [Cupriavidus sp. USMAA2-4]|uniref:DUF1295 domain-containing protein n=2 Tax=Cupriavidus TaxID=106589 RepID=A0ABM6F4W7_9BURK|nr:hypothetical protein BKK79_01845 [Cupriavidus sp. USMAA2-4]AOY99677.1 hypothetical protein BKK81_10735 [Cupriavidus sp. USMAHM13]AOZ06300.1 hypothetical protein BKK80_10990 [Cupriavidus malaysiensis]